MSQESQERVKVKRSLKHDPVHIGHSPYGGKWLTLCRPMYGLPGLLVVPWETETTCSKCAKKAGLTYPERKPKPGLCKYCQGPIVTNGSGYKGLRLYCTPSCRQQWNRALFESNKKKRYGNAKTI